MTKTVEFFGGPLNGQFRAIEKDCSKFVCVEWREPENLADVIPKYAEVVYEGHDNDSTIFFFRGYNEPNPT